METATLKNLYNPDNVTAVLLKSEGYIEPMENQAFQVYYSDKKMPTIVTSIELWQDMGDGRILRVCKWIRKSIMAIY